jgi:uncharacterized protein (TIGR03437 family)
MNFFLGVLLIVLATYSLRTSSAQAQPPNLLGRWKVEIKFSTIEEHTLRFDAQAGGKGTFLLLDTVSNLIPPAEPTQAQWGLGQQGSAAPDQVTFSGGIEFPIGNVGRDVGTLVFKGSFQSPNSISGKVSFFRVGQDPKDPATVPAKSGDFTATRSTTSSATNLSAASFIGTTLASQAIVAAFGSNLAIATQAAATLPLPTSLGNTTVTVINAGVERSAGLLFVSPAQVNYVLPAETGSDAATVVITSGDGSVATETIKIVDVAPGLFSANANGQGVAAAVALRVKSDGTQSYEPVAQFDTAQSKFVSRPIDLGQTTDQVFLVLFGTGIRGRSALSGVTASVGGIASEVIFAGPQGRFDGLDQVNLRLPRSLAGRGEIDVALMVDGKAANTVQVEVD